MRDWKFAEELAIEGTLSRADGFFLGLSPPLRTQTSEFRVKAIRRKRKV